MIDAQEKSEQGALNRRRGKEFERAVRKELELDGWLVVRFDQNPNSITNKLKKCLPMFIPGKGLIMNSSGFPDFICINIKSKEVKFMECKINGYLKPEEQKKAEWIRLNLNIPLFVAYKKINQIEYKLYDK